MKVGDLVLHKAHNDRCACEGNHGIILEIKYMWFPSENQLTILWSNEKVQHKVPESAVEVISEIT